MFLGTHPLGCIQMQTIEGVPNDQNYIYSNNCPIQKKTCRENWWHPKVLVLGKNQPKSSIFLCFNDYVCSVYSCKNKCTDFPKIYCFFKLDEINVGKIDSTPLYLYFKNTDRTYKFSQFRMIINCQKLCSSLF